LQLVDIIILRKYGDWDISTVAMTSAEMFSTAFVGIVDIFNNIPLPSRLSD
jgi:hypothetical protein